MQYGAELRQYCLSFDITTNENFSPLLVISSGEIIKYVDPNKEMNVSKLQHYIMLKVILYSNYIIFIDFITKYQEF